MDDIVGIVEPSVEDQTKMVGDALRDGCTHVIGVDPGSDEGDSSVIVEKTPEGFKVVG